MDTVFYSNYLALEYDFVIKRMRFGKVNFLVKIFRVGCYGSVRQHWKDDFLRWGVFLRHLTVSFQDKLTVRIAKVDILLVIMGYSAVNYLQWNEYFNIISQWSYWTWVFIMSNLFKIRRRGLSSLTLLLEKMCNWFFFSFYLKYNWGKCLIVWVICVKIPLFFMPKNPVCTSALSFWWGILDVQSSV